MGPQVAAAIPKTLVMHLMDVMYIHNVTDIEAVRQKHNTTAYTSVLSLSLSVSLCISLCPSLLLVPILHQIISFFTVKFIK